MDFQKRGISLEFYPHFRSSSGALGLYQASGTTYRGPVQHRPLGASSEPLGPEVWGGAQGFACLTSDAGGADAAGPGGLSCEPLRI